ncbi:MAG: cation transporter, partial [Verrucomicrobia bacterium]|nr:cation transporter [Verrucomicrobiota bacterium]
MTTEQTTKPQPAPQVEASASTPTELAITGMSCGNCARHAMEALQGVPGVRSAAVSLEPGGAAVRWDAGAAQDVPALLR